MNINFSVRNVEITQDTKDYAIEKAQKLEKIYRLRRVDLVLEQEGDQYKLEMVASPERGGTLVATARASDWFSTIDSVNDKLERQLRKNKEKITSHRVKKYPLHESEEGYDDIMRNY